MVNPGFWCVPSRSSTPAEFTASSASATPSRAEPPQELSSSPATSAHATRLPTRSTWDAPPPSLLRLLPDGHVLSDGATQKIRSGEKGWRYASQLLTEFGATAAPDNNDDRREWLHTWLPRITTQVRHRGNHKSAWPLCHHVRRQLPSTL